MKYLLALGLLSISTLAFAGGNFEKLVPGTAAVWNLKQADKIFSTIYISGDAAKEIFENLAGQNTQLPDESGHPTGNYIKSGKDIVCMVDYNSNYRCNLNFDGKSGSVGK